MDDTYKGKLIAQDIYESIQIKEIEIVDEKEDSMEVTVVRYQQRLIERKHINRTAKYET